MPEDCRPGHPTAPQHVPPPPPPCRYGQAGTPHLHISTSYDAAAQTYTITAKQVVKPTPGQAHKEPVLIPIALGLLGPDGEPRARRTGSQAGGPIQGHWQGQKGRARGKEGHRQG